MEAPYSGCDWLKVSGSPEAVRFALRADQSLCESLCQRLCCWLGSLVSQKLHILAVSTTIDINICRLEPKSSLPQLPRYDLQRPRERLCQSSMLDPSHRQYKNALIKKVFEL